MIEIIKMYKRAPVSDDPKTTMPEKRQQRAVRTFTNKVNQLSRERKEKVAAFDLGYREEWKQRDDRGEAATGQNLQTLGRQKLDKSWVGERIEYSTYCDVNNEGKEKKLRWIGVEILDVSDGPWLMPGARTKYYVENEAAYVLWDPVSEENYPACKSIEVFSENK